MYQEPEHSNKRKSHQYCQLVTYPNVRNQFFAHNSDNEITDLYLTSSASVKNQSTRPEKTIGPGSILFSPTAFPPLLSRGRKNKVQERYLDESQRIASILCPADAETHGTCGECGGT